MKSTAQPLLKSTVVAFDSNDCMAEEHASKRSRTSSSKASKITILAEDSEELHLTILNLNGAICSQVDAKQSWTVAQLAQAVEEATKLPAYEQSLLCGMTKLSSSDVLGSVLPKAGSHQLQLVLSTPFLRKLPRFNKCQHTLLPGYTEEQLQIAEQVLQKRGAALPGGRLPDFLREIYATVGGQKVHEWEYCKKSLFRNHGLLCKLPSSDQPISGLSSIYPLKEAVPVNELVLIDFHDDEMPKVLHRDGLIFASAHIEENTWRYYWHDDNIYKLDDHCELKCLGSVREWQNKMLEEVESDDDLNMPKDASYG